MRDRFINGAGLDGVAFVTPPENSGQIVTTAYGYDMVADCVVERVDDGSDQSMFYTAYNIIGKYEPWNQAPKLGRLLGPWNPEPR